MQHPVHTVPLVLLAQPKQCCKMWHDSLLLLQGCSELGRARITRARTHTHVSTATTNTHTCSHSLKTTPCLCKAVTSTHKAEGETPAEKEKESKNDPHQPHCCHAERLCTACKALCPTPPTLSKPAHQLRHTSTQTSHPHTHGSAGGSIPTLPVLNEPPAATPIAANTQHTAHSTHSVRARP